MNVNVKRNSASQVVRINKRYANAREFDEIYIRMLDDSSLKSETVDAYWKCSAVL